MQCWEYWVVDIVKTGKDLQAALDQAGQNGWELVTVNGSSSYVMLIFKRPK